MATLAQLNANRANAQRSTGPRSVEGKSASRFNALKHGVDAHSSVIPGEDPEEYQSLATEYAGRFQPQTPDEHYHIQTMIDSDWQKRRLSRLETQLYQVIDTESPDLSLAEALLTASPAAKLLARTQRQLAAHQRAWYRAFTEFRRQREREAEQEEGPFYPPYEAQAAEPDTPGNLAFPPEQLPEETDDNFAPEYELALDGLSRSPLTEPQS